jgi:hypothetical protein
MSLLENTPFSLSYLPLSVVFVAEEEAPLPPFLGSTLRGALGQALHDDARAFSYLYEQRRYDVAHKDTPNPYVLVPPPMRNEPYRAGEELRFDLLLLGDAAMYADAAVHALERIREAGLGYRKHAFSLRRVSHRADRRIVWQDGSLRQAALRSVPLPCENLPDVTRLSLRTLTPLRIRRDGQLLTQVDFPTLVRNVTNRVQRLCAFFGGTADETEIQELQRLAETVRLTDSTLKLWDLERFSSTRGAKMDFGGLMGDARFEGDLSPFVPWLCSAEVLHIGRNTTFGMGRVELEWM